MTLPHPSGAQPGATYDASSPWSYVCGQCGACCRDKDFIVTPYDVARLADAMGLLPAQVLARYVDPSRPALRVKRDGSCVFFKDGEGCTVHAGRPAVCRLYPLGRTVTAAGRVLFEEATPNAETKGQYGRDGTIGGYLVEQGLEPYLEAIKRIGAFMDDAFALASRSGVLEHLDAAVHATWTGEGGPLPFSAMGLDLLAPVSPFDDALDKLASHLDALRELCGMDTPPEAQERLPQTQEGRAKLGRLVVIAAALGVGLGLSPGFSAAAGQQGG